MERKIKKVTEEMKVNDNLFYKMRNEQEEYLKKVRLLSSEEVVRLADEIALRNLILDTMEKNDLSFKAANALINNSRPLSFIYEYFINNNITFKLNFKKQMEKCGCECNNKRKVQFTTAF